MPLQYDPDTSEIRYEGKVVGRYDYKDGTARVSVNPHLRVRTGRMDRAGERASSFSLHPETASIR
jgi:hypothetical protein